MRISFVLVSLLLLFFGCTSGTSTDSDSAQKRVEQKLDSLLKVIVEMRRQQAREDSLHSKEADSTSVVQHQDAEVKPAVKSKPERVAPAKKPNQPANDTTYHYYSNKKLSVKITPWVEGKRKIFFYDLKGEQTFSLEDVRMSYSIITHLQFHPNGAASKAEINNNPGASRYWYETVITFDTDNTPLVKTEQQMPIERIDLENLPSFWNKEKQQWIKQEIVKETSTPPGK